MSLRPVLSRRLVVVLCTIALVLAATSVGSVQAQSADLSGNYAVSGTNPSGSTYVGTLTIAPSKATLSSSVTVYQLAWTIAGDKSVGLGVLYGNTMAVTFGTQNCVLSIYDLQNQNKDGSVSGVWSNITNQTFGTETLTFVKSLANDHASAQYSIVGTNPDNSTYKGQLTADGYGLLYDLSWTVGSDTTNGVGLLLPNPDAIVAASAAQSTEACNVMVYQVSNGNLFGTWASVGSKVTGTELAIKS